MNEFRLWVHPRDGSVFSESHPPTVVVYTSITGKIRDDLRVPAQKAVVPGVRFVCFTDRKFPGDRGPWDIRTLPWSHPSDPRRSSRYCKMHPHTLFESAKYSLWLDGSIELLENPLRLIDKYLADKDFAVFKHRLRDCLFDELKACIKLKKDDESLMRRQVQRYRDHGYPEKAGMVETGVLLRRHTKRVAEFNEAWWKEIDGFSRRDQLSFNYLSRELGLTYNHFEGNMDKNSHFKHHPHR